MARMEQNYKISEHDEMGKGTWSMMAQKNRNKKLQKRVQKFFSKKIFFDPKISKNLYFWPFLSKKFIELASTPRGLKVHVSMMAQKNRNKVL